MANVWCPDCDCHSLIGEGDGKCSTCHGNGKQPPGLAREVVDAICAPLEELIPGEEVEEEHEECETCGGSGDCPTCDGEGSVEEDEEAAPSE